MPAPISIIIPTLNAGAELPGCFLALEPGLMSGLIREVLVIDGGSTDRTILPAHQAGARVICGTKGRGRQMHCGAMNARGDWLLFLHADTQLSETWAEQVAAHLQTHQDKAAAFRLAYRSPSRNARWLEKRANRRASFMGLPYGDQGLLIPRKLYNEVGGFSDIPLMEDVEIVRKISKNRLVILDCEARTSADKYERDGWHRRSWSNALLLTRYLMGASPEKLANRYR